MKFISPAIKPLLAVLLILNGRSSVSAATPVVPSAGSLLQQVSPATPVPRPTGEPSLTIDRGRDAGLPSSDPFLVKTIRIRGNTLFGDLTLHALVAEAEGKTLTLAQLGERVARITEYYHVHGYPLAQAVILAQVIQEGVLVIDVIEARYGEITLNNLSTVKSSLLRQTLSPLQSGKPIEGHGLNRALLLLSDVPGVVVNTTLRPGETVGTSDLSVDATRGRTVAGSATLDNYGDDSTGNARGSATFTFFNPLHHGDVLSVSGLSSGRGTNYGRLAYDFLLTGQGARVGGAYSTLHYILGGPFSSLDAHGTAESKTLWAKTPFHRSEAFNMYGQIQYDALSLRDRIDAGLVRTDRHLDNLTLSLTGDLHDSILGGGLTVWSLGAKTGRVAYDDAHARTADAATAGTAGRFSKWNVNVARLQGLAPKTGLYLAFAGQWTNSNLDSSEKMNAGGPYSVRAYDIGVVAGDSGYFATAEIRRDFGETWRTRWQGVVFTDHAQLRLNHAPWAGGGNHVALSGAGVGLNCTVSENWSARISGAVRIGSAHKLVPNAASTRCWIEISRQF